MSLQLPGYLLKQARPTAVSDEPCPFGPLAKLSSIDLCPAHYFQGSPGMGSSEKEPFSQQRYFRISNIAPQGHVDLSCYQIVQRNPSSSHRSDTIAQILTVISR